MSSFLRDPSIVRFPWDYRTWLRSPREGYLLNRMGRKLTEDHAVHDNGWARYVELSNLGHSMSSFHKV